MSSTTIHQARTIIHHTEEQHLLIQTMFDSERASLRIFNSKPDGRRESEATIYLSAEQWAELAMVAAEQAKKNLPTDSNSSDYLNDAQVNAWQDANIAAAYEKKLMESLKFSLFPTKQAWVRPWGIPQDHIDELQKRGLIECTEGPRVTVRVTDKGVAATQA